MIFVVVVVCFFFFSCIAFSEQKLSYVIVYLFVICLLVCSL